MSRFSSGLIAWGSYFTILLLLPDGLKAQLNFIPNAGQWEYGFQYRADIPGGAAFLQGSTIVYNFSNGGGVAHHLRHPHDEGPVDSVVTGHAIALQFLGASEKLSMIPEKPYPTIYNYYRGPSRHWRSGLRASANIRYRDLYTGIDMLLETSGDALKYTYIVKPGADPAAVRMYVKGASSVRLKNGDLQIITSVNEVTETAPVAWQISGDKKVNIPCRYALSENIVSYEFPGGFDPDLELIIDPYVVFATYTGSPADNFGYTATYDASGHAYGGGDVWEIGYPVTLGAYKQTFNGGELDVAIIKYLPDGSNREYATYLGGKRRDRPHSMIVNSKNELLVMGTTVSEDFPVTAAGFDIIKSDTLNEDIFIARFSADGKQLIASTYVGGSGNDGVNRANQHPLKFNYADEYRGEIITDSADNVYVASVTQSFNFPVTSNTMDVKYQNQEGCVFKLDPGLSVLHWSTFVGGAAIDAAYSLQLDKKGDIYVCGGTTSPFFFDDSRTYQNVLIPPTAPVDNADNADAFVCHITGDSGQLINATYLGSDGYEQAYFVQLDTSGLVYLFGQNRTDSFPLVKPRYLDKGGSQFISVFNPELDTLILSTRFGSGRKLPDISPTAFLIDNCGAVYVSGWGGKTNSPRADGIGGHGGSTTGMRVTPDAFQPATDGSDFYFAVFALKIDTLLFASFFGNSNVEEHVDGGTSRFDKNAVVYQSICGSCGYTTNPNPDPITTPGAFSRINKGKRADNHNEIGCNNLVIKLDMRIPDILAGFDAPSLLCKSNDSEGGVHFKNTSIRGKAFLWDFGDGTTSQDFSPIHDYKDPGTYSVRLIAFNPHSCSLADTVSKVISIQNKASAAFEIREVDCSGTATFEALPGAQRYSWDFGDGAYGSERQIKHTYEKTGVYTVTLYVDTGLPCPDTFTMEINPAINKPTPPEVPNVFTPNGDNLNEVFEISSSSHCAPFEIKIYNRWGQLVHKEKGNPLRWDGRSLSEHKLPAGVYYYVLTDPVYGEKHGTVTMLRE